MSDRPSRFARRKPQDPLTRRDEALAFVANDETWHAPDWFALTLTVAAFVALFFLKVDALWAILAGGAIGLLHAWLK